MATTVTLTLVIRDGDKIFARFDDGSEQEYASLDQLKLHLSELDSGASGRHAAQCLLLGWWIARSPDATNTNLVEGKRLTYDLSAASPIRVQ